jgi:hypothetical protein
VNLDGAEITFGLPQGLRILAFGRVDASGRAPVGDDPIHVGVHVGFCCVGEGREQCSRMIPNSPRVFFRLVGVDLPPDVQLTPAPTNETDRMLSAGQRQPTGAYRRLR